MKTSDRISRALATGGATLKGIAKLILGGRPADMIKAEPRTEPLIILGNGPSLRQTIDNCGEALRRYPLMAVNFAANTPEFFELRPEYYVLADPHFANTSDPNVEKLMANLRKVDWPMTILAADTLRLPQLPNIRTRHFAARGIEGAQWLRDFAIASRRGMPRPRNVMVCAIMCGIWLGYREIYITGADHSWTRTLSVNDSNEVVSVQPHYYEEPGSEKERVTAVYRDVKLHEILDSFRIAFKAYHDIEDYARRHGIDIYNASPGSFIDAFRRRNL